MTSRTQTARIYRWLAALSLAAYGTLGVFGHSLHGLLPCGDESCGVAHSAVENHCCCGHEHAAAKSTLSPATDGTEFRGAGHDADDCSLCILLAKIKVGRLALLQADVQVGSAYHEQVAVSELLPADLILSGAPRGPPLA